MSLGKGAFVPLHGDVSLDGACASMIDNYAVLQLERSLLCIASLFIVSRRVVRSLWLAIYVAMQGDSRSFV